MCWNLPTKRDQARHRIRQAIEADRKGRDDYNNPNGWAWTPEDETRAREQLAALEALDLVKFEEPRVAPPAEVIARSTVTTANRATRQLIGADDAERIILNLEACGFQIVRKDAR